jgi:hypothetical protein
MDFGINPMVVAFVLLSPATAVILLRRMRLSLVLLISLLCVLGSWGTLWGAELWIDARWVELMREGANPSPELVEAFNRDGASKTAILFVGLPLSIAYLVLWVVVAKTLRSLWRKMARVHA